MGTTNLKRTLKVTEDGSHTLYVPELDEHYHSVHGAKQESQHVFIQSGLHYCCKSKTNLHIFEVGFGTGLNALLTLKECKALNINVNYTSVEKYPISHEEIRALNYSSILPGFEDVFYDLHRAKWNETIQITEIFTLKKVETDLVGFQHSGMYDLVYFDAFAPDLQPDLWSEEVFSQLYQSLNKNGILVTYSAKGFVKRNLKAAGFTVTKIPGPPGKREMIRALK